jgi:hypothetical protein
VHRLLNDGPYIDEEFVIDSLSRMALAYLGLEDHGRKPAKRK